MIKVNSFIASNKRRNSKVKNTSNYFDIINKSDIFVFYDHVQYDKNGLRNRNRILVKNQIKWLTLPVKKAKLGTKIKDIEIHNPKFELNKIKRIIYELPMGQ